jgi:hypothetical protein
MPHLGLERAGGDGSCPRRITHAEEGYKPDLNQLIKIKNPCTAFAKLVTIKQNTTIQIYAYYRRTKNSTPTILFGYRQNLSC